MKTSRCRVEEAKTHREQFEREREQKGRKFSRVGVVDVTPTKNVLFFSLNGAVG